VPLINRLVDLGLVERVKTERDKRKRLLVATAKGLEVYQQVKTVADDLREEILTAITPRSSGRLSGCWKSCCARLRKNNAASSR
jgi:DNA-binding MarR family transcriptional regulator